MCVVRYIGHDVKTHILANYASLGKTTCKHLSLFNFIQNFIQFSLAEEERKFRVAK